MDFWLDVLLILRVRPIDVVDMTVPFLLVFFLHIRVKPFNVIVCFAGTGRRRRLAELAVGFLEPLHSGEGGQFEI